MNAALAQQLAEGASVTESFVATVSDAQFAIDTVVVSVIVTRDNDTPFVTTAADQDAGALTEGSETVSASGQLTASDPDLGDTFSWSGTSAATLGVFTLT